MSATPRSRGRATLAFVLALLALNAWAQVVLVPLGRSDDPPALTALQLLIGAAAAAAAWGSWRATRWAAAAAALWATLTAGMLVALPRMLALPADARGGILTGAGIVLAFGLWAAWFLRPR